MAMPPACRYDADGDGYLSVDDLALLMAEVDAAYGRSPLPADLQCAEAAMAMARLSHGGGALSLSGFRDAVGSLQLRGCSRLFRFDAPLFSDVGGAVSDTRCAACAAEGGGPSPAAALASA
eukprot:4890654-Prymnesium_polylepis.1